MVPRFATWVRLSVGRWPCRRCARRRLAVREWSLAVLGNIDWACGSHSIAVIPGARIGAHWRSVSIVARLAVAVVLGSIALAYGAGEIVALAF